MKMTKIALLLCCSLACSSALGDTGFGLSMDRADSAPVSEGLSDFDWFRIFPYIDKSYSLAAEGRLSEALVEVKKARQIVPDHLPLVFHQAQLLIDSGRGIEALEILQAYLENSHAQRAYASILSRSDSVALLTLGQFIEKQEALSVDLREDFVRAYLVYRGDELNRTQLVELAEVLDLDQLSSEVSSQLAEYLFRNDGADAVVGMLQPLCEQGECSERQRSQLVQGFVMTEQFAGIETWLLPLSDPEFDRMLGETSNRMIGAERTDDLIELLLRVDGHRPLREDWERFLFRLALNQQQTAVALALAQRVAVDCLTHAELLMEDGQTAQAAAQLNGCQPHERDEQRYVVLAQQIGEPELLEGVQFSTADAEQSRIALLVDSYSRDNQTGSLIRILEDSSASSPSLQRLLAQTHYDNGNIDEAIAVSQRNWLMHRDASSLDYLTFILLQEDRYAELLHIAQNERGHVTSTHLANDPITQRLMVAVQEHHNAAADADLVRAAQRWPNMHLSVTVSEVLTQRQNCTAVLQVREQLSGVAAHRVDSHCLDTPAERLAALERYQAQWGDDERLRGAVLAYESSDFDKALTYLESLSPNVERGAYKPLELSALLASGQEEAAWAQWQALSEPLSADEMNIGVQIALRLDDPDSLQTALQRVQAEPQLGLPIRLRLAEIDGDLEAQLNLFERLAEENPENGYYPLAQAYTLQSLGRHNDAALMFDATFSQHPETRNIETLEQAAYVNLQARRQPVARQQLTEVIDMRHEDGQQGTEALDRSQRFYREVASPWRASMSGWVGESTSLSQATGNDFQADYFLSTMLEYNLDYGRERRSNLTVFANLLSAGDSFFFDSNNLDVGLAWKPMENHQSFLRVASRTSFDESETRIYLRASTDLLASYNRQKQWIERRRLVDHSLYLDWLFFPDEQTSSFYVRYQPTFQFNGASSSYFKLGAYPFVQYQWTDDTFDQQRLTDTRAGLGVTWRQPIMNAHYPGWLVYSEVGLEWQYVVDSQIAGSSDNALLLRFAVYF